jgi:hypothetical protein
MDWPIVRADDERWEVRIDRFDPHPGIHALVFFCLSNPQRPWHVVEVPADQVPGADELAALPEDRLVALFADSDPMDFPHDTVEPNLPPEHPLPPPPPGYEGIDAPR